MFNNLMERLRESYSPNISENPAIAEAKQNGKMVFGYMCTNSPEELLDAAGILPVRYLGASVNVTDANQYQTTYMCHYARSILELGLNKEYKDLDGQVYTYGCDGGSNLYQILMETVPQKYQRFLYMPHNMDSVGSLEFYMEELKAFKKSLEEYLNKEISDDEIKESIKLYNQHKDLLQTIYDMRGLEKRPLFKGSEVAEIIEYAVSVSKTQSNDMLRQLIEAASSREVEEWVGPRVIGVGTMVDKEFQKVIEDLGGMVVGDTFCIGKRYFFEKVDEELPPLEALSQYVKNKLPCHCMGHKRVPEQYLDEILKQVKQYNAHGVVLANQKWCDPIQFDRPYILEELQSLGIPTIVVDIERTVDTSQIRNRLESFMEMIKLNKNYQKSISGEVK